MSQTYTALVLCGMVAMTTAACYIQDTVDTDRNDVNMAGQNDCVHPDYKMITIYNGFQLRTPNCLHITCTNGEMHVCGYGWALRSVMWIPDYCIHKQVGDCGIEAVMKSNENLRCDNN